MSQLEKDQIRRAVEIVGSQKAMGEALRITPGFVSQWCNGTRQVSPRYCLKIQKLTKGKVKAVQLRPDIFGG